MRMIVRARTGVPGRIDASALSSAVCCPAVENIPSAGALLNDGPSVNDAKSGCVLANGAASFLKSLKLPSF